MGRSVGRGMREFKSALSMDSDEDAEREKRSGDEKQTARQA
jgi:Sec-independent protein translocase protein TatA